MGNKTTGMKIFYYLHTVSKSYGAGRHLGEDGFGGHNVRVHNGRGDCVVQRLQAAGRVAPACGPDAMCKKGVRIK